MSGQSMKWKFSASREVLTCIAQNQIAPERRGARKNKFTEEDVGCLPRETDLPKAVGYQ